MKAPGYLKGTPFEDGPLFAKSADLGTFAAWPENADALRQLNKRLKLYRGESGWFAHRAQGQLWEYGPGRLGFTVKTATMVRRALEAGYTPTQRGDSEANFACEWTDENVTRLTKLLRLRTRGVGNLNPKPMPEQFLKKPPPEASA